LLPEVVCDEFEPDFLAANSSHASEEHVRIEFKASFAKSLKVRQESISDTSLSS
jgi:hypothetical protein